MSKNESYSSPGFITRIEDEDDPLANCRRDPDGVRELERIAEENGHDAFAAACRAVLEEVDQS